MSEESRVKCCFNEKGWDTFFEEDYLVHSTAYRLIEYAVTSKN